MQDTIQIIIATFIPIVIINLSASSILSTAAAATNNNGGASTAHLITDTFTERNSNTYYADSVYRNLDTQLLRIGSRLDQLMIRMDHLDSRVGRVQSTGHLRFDSIETSMQTTRQRLDLWSNQLNLMEEQLTRKWKNMESRFDSLVSTLDSKLDTKFNLIQRDNRRHNEFISQSFNSVIISQERLNERVTNSINELNSTLHSTESSVNASLSATKSDSSTCVTRLDTFLSNLTSSTEVVHNARRSSNAIQPTDQVGFPRLPMYSSYPSSQNLNHHHHQSPLLQNSTAQLVSSKVSNMFDDLVKRSHELEAIVKDTFTMSNMTRREVQDGFMALIPIVSQVGFGNNNNEKSTGASGEIMSMVVEALSSMEQASTSLGRRMSELNRSINERFEMVSMSLNGFLESCLRIQDKTPQLEEKLAEVLHRILDSVDISTRNATETWEKVKHELLKARHTNASSNCTEKVLVDLERPLEIQNSSSSLYTDTDDPAFEQLFRAYESLQDNNNELNESSHDDHEEHHHQHHHHTRHQHGLLEHHSHQDELPELSEHSTRSRTTQQHGKQEALSEDQRKIWEILSRLAIADDLSETEHEQHHVPDE